MLYGTYSMMKILWLTAVVLALNAPFGYWRAGARKFSAPWICAIHIPVPMVLALRIYSGLGWRPATFPVMIGAFILGKFIGGKLRRK
jgi:hypothetical protein